MSAQLEKVRLEAHQLTPDEQQVLAVELIDSAWGDYELDDVVQRAWDAELAKRAEDIRTGRVQAIPWDTVRAELANEFGWDK